MNIFALIFGLTQGIVKGIQVVVGDKASGADKKTMAKDALTAAISTAGSVLTGSNAVYGALAGQIADIAIDQSVAIAKANGHYDKWTEIAKAAQTDLTVAQNVTDIVKSVQAPAPAPAAA